MKPGRPAPYTQADMEQALAAAGLQAGDTVFFTTSLGMLGLPAGLDLEDGDGLNRRCLAAIRAVLGPAGTALVPTYSYTFGKGTASAPAVFEPATTPAEIGPFPEFFRQQPGVYRALDPMMSVAGQGPRALPLLADLAPTSYGAGGVFARLLGQGVKCCSIGLGPNWMPFIHHADWLARVPYRYDKLFRGRLFQDGQAVDANWLYSVLIQHPAARASAHALAAAAEAAGIWRHAPLGRARVYVADYDAYFAFTRQQQANNPWATAEGPAGDVLALEDARVPVESTPCLAENADTATLLAAYATMPRSPVSATSQALLAALAQREGLALHRWRTGENHFDWVIPERWRVTDARLTTADGTPLLPLVDLTRRVWPHSLSYTGEVTAAQLQTRSLPDPHWRHAPGGPSRDWGLDLTPSELAGLPQGGVHLTLKCDFALGEMVAAAGGTVPAAGPWALLYARVDGPAEAVDAAPPASTPCRSDSSPCRTDSSPCRSGFSPTSRAEARPTPAASSATWAKPRKPTSRPEARPTTCASTLARHPNLAGVALALLAYRACQALPLAPRVVCLITAGPAGLAAWLDDLERARPQSLCRLVGLAGLGLAADQIGVPGGHPVANETLADLHLPVHAWGAPNSDDELALAHVVAGIRSWLGEHQSDQRVSHAFG